MIAEPQEGGPYGHSNDQSSPWAQGGRCRYGGPQAPYLRLLSIPAQDGAAGVGKKGAGRQYRPGKDSLPPGGRTWGDPDLQPSLCTQFLDDSIVSEREQGRRIGLEMLKDADELWCFSEYISEGMMAEIQEASRLGLPVRMFCETTGLLGKVLKRVVSDLYSDADGQDRQ